MSALKLVTDRTVADRLYIEGLNKKGLCNMTAEERFYWRYGTLEAVELLDGAFETSDGYTVGVGNGLIKGSYKHTDLTRVDKAVQYIAQKAVQLIHVIDEYRMVRQVAPDKVLELPYVTEDVDVAPPQQWLEGKIPTQHELNVFLQNVETLKSLLDSAAPELPNSMNRLSVDGANSIEKALEAIEVALTDTEARLKDMINRIANSLFYSCEVYSGEV